MYDSVKQFAKALEGLINAKHITTAILSCDLEDKWQFGDSLANFMKIVSRILIVGTINERNVVLFKVKTNGITGDIKFHARSGLRTGLKLDILELEYEGFKLVIGKFNNSTESINCECCCLSGWQLDFAGQG